METMLDPETIEKWDETRGVVSAQINSKHKHNTQNRQMTENSQNVAKQNKTDKKQI